MKSLIKNQADSFRLVALECQKPIQLSENTIQVHLIPAVVNAAFSCELYLKGILKDNGINFMDKNLLPVRERHSLYSLFHLLPLEKQNYVKAKMNLSESDYNNALKNISTSFEDWRYVFESESLNCNCSFLFGLMEILYSSTL